jgi:hypothetical protein
MAELAAVVRDLGWSPVAPPPPDTDGRSADPALGGRIAEVCRRLRELLGQLPGGDGPLLGGGAILLAGLADIEFSPWPPMGAVERLQARLGCSPVEMDIAILAGLADEHEAFAGVFRMLHPRGEPRPTVGLAAQLFCDTSAERPQFLRALELGRAVGAGLLRVGPPEAPAFERSLALADGLWLVLRGIDTWPAAAGHRPGGAVMAGLDDWLADAPASRAGAAIRRAAPWTILLTGDDEDAALERGVALAEHTAVPWVRLVPAALTPDIARLIAIHALARGVVPVIRVPPSDGPAGGTLPELDDHPAPVVLASRPGRAAIAGLRPLLPVAVEPLDFAARRRMWEALLPALGGRAASLAARHIVEPSLAARAAGDLRGIELLDRRLGTPGDVIGSIRARAGHAISQGVALVHPNATWNQLVLPEPRLSQLRDAVGRLTHQERVLDDWRFLAGRRGVRGVRILFAGVPGTGKTLAAEVLAAELGVDLLIVDIARVVSKWIGETEKNLAQVFDAAERMNGVLLFDEADALFGKRTEVSDAHDRYANLETAYLLARLERSEGLVILATNLRANVDPAFMRRLEAVVTFEEPGPAERRALWRCHIPTEAPLAPDVDFEELSTLFPVVGGVIRNAAVAAAFLAASDGGRIRRDHLIRAVQREYEKQGRAFPAIPVTPDRRRT